MQLYAILNELWRRRIVVGIALVVSVFLGLMVAFKVSPGLPPKLTSRSHEIGVASTRVLINTEKETAQARQAIAAVVGAQNILPMPPGMMGGEDFSWMLEKIPGCYVALGNGATGHGSCMIHNPGYDFNDQALPIGVSYWATLVDVAPWQVIFSL